MRLRPGGPAALVLLLLWAAAATAQPAPEVRAMWVVRTTLTSPAGITAMIAAAREAGINTLFVQVRGRGDAYYADGLEPRAAALAGTPPGFDPLALVLAQARAAGLAVHAWVNVNLVADASTPPASSHHLVRRHPDWLMLPRELSAELGRMNPKNRRYVERLAAWTRGQSAAVEGLYASPLHPDAARHVVKVIERLVAKYPVDGVHLDYVRFPGSRFDVSRAALEAFEDHVSPGLPRAARRDLERAARTNRLVYIDRYPATWEQFRRDRLTDLVRRVSTAVRAKRPGTLVSAAAVPEAAEARETRFQDWPSWLAAGLIDAVCPMAYTTDAEVFRRQIAAARAAASGRRLFAGIGAYRLSGDQTFEHIRLAREAGADGFILFSYSSLSAPGGSDDVLTRLGQAGVGR